MKTFRGGTAAELIPFRLDDGEDLIPTLARAAEELNVGSAAVVMGSGTLSVARLVAAGTGGPSPARVIAEHQGPLPIVSIQGWILANQPELQVVLSRGAELIAGRAMPGCRAQGSVEGLLLRLGNLRLGRVSDPDTGEWLLSTGAALSEMPRIELQGHTVDPRALLKVPPPLIQRYRVLPVSLSGDTLIVAIENPRDPSNVFALDDLRLATGMRIQWVGTPQDALDAAINQVLEWLNRQGEAKP